MNINIFLKIIIDKKMIITYNKNAKSTRERKYRLLRENERHFDIVEEVLLNFKVSTRVHSETYVNI